MGWEDWAEGRPERWRDGWRNLSLESQGRVLQLDGVSVPPDLTPTPTPSLSSSQPSVGRGIFPFLSAQPADRSLLQKESLLPIPSLTNSRPLLVLILDRALTVSLDGILLPRNRGPCSLTRGAQTAGKPRLGSGRPLAHRLEG